MNLRKSHLAAAVGAAFMVGGTAVQAQTPGVTSGQPLQIQLYGHVNRALMYVDNETANKWFFVDNQVSSSRFGIMGSADIGGGLRAGSRLETEIRSNRSNEVNFVSPTNGISARLHRALDRSVPRGLLGPGQPRPGLGRG